MKKTKKVKEDEYTFGRCSICGNETVLKNGVCIFCDADETDPGIVSILRDSFKAREEDN